VEKPELSGKRARFVDEYLVDSNATQAAIRSGYSAKRASITGVELLRDSRVSRAVEARKAVIHEKLEITQEWVRAGLKEVAERCTQRVAVMVRRGKETEQATETTECPQCHTLIATGVWTFDSSGANRAFELLGKDQAMFVERKLDLNAVGEAVTQIQAALDRALEAAGLDAGTVTRIREQFAKHLRPDSAGSGSEVR
jgi:phage terminase small subunit